MNSSYAHKIILNVLNVMSHNLNLGKTKLMKIIYMLQQVKKLNLGYDFDIYTYGPYSSEVLESIEVLANKGLVLSKMYQYNNYVGYELNLTDEGRRTLSNISKEDNAAIRDILDFAEGKTARNLELFSTIIFINSFYSQNKLGNGQTVVIEKVRELKPHFDKSSISEAYNTLANKGYLRV